MKFLARIRNLFKPKKHWMEVAFDRFMEEHKLSEVEAAYIASCEQELELTQGRPVILLPPSATIH